MGGAAGATVIVDSKIDLGRILCVAYSEPKRGILSAQTAECGIFVLKVI